MMNRDQLSDFLDDLLGPKQFQDYGPNGLQVEGSEDIKKIAFAVSATRDSIAEAIKQDAQALIVHHGLFWRFHGPKTVTGPFAKRLKPLIQNDINLFGYHLPLDAHIEYGNAAGLAKAFGMENLEPFAFEKGAYIGVKAELKTPMNGADFAKKLETVLGHNVLHACPTDAGTIQSIGIITGGANSQWSVALSDGLDAYITGEMSEHDWNEARESDIHMFAGGHHATERFGVLSLKALIEKEFEVETVFIDSENPA
tara:strand:+ start:926 stop:1690 length:765 start_codon:yes stop_codon:yes gene_type:complete